MSSIRRMALCAIALAGLSPVAGCGHATTPSDGGTQADSAPMEDACTGPSCNPITCDPSRTTCGNDCVDTSTNATHCGSCTNACAPSQTCMGGSCMTICSGSTPNACGTSCVDFTTDAQHCGSCTNACTGGDVCSSGTCAPNCTGACNNGMGFHLTGGGSTFDLTHPNEALEVYVH